MTIGLFIGRMQPIHNGHVSVIKKAVGGVDTLIIGVGSSQYSNTEENPYSFEQRKEMIEAVLKEENITNCKIIPIPDIHNHPKWVEHVVSVVGKFDVLYTGNDINKKLFKEKGYKVKDIEIAKGVSGTKIRKLMKEGKDIGELVPEGVKKRISSIAQI